MFPATPNSRIELPRYACTTLWVRSTTTERCAPAYSNEGFAVAALTASGATLGETRPTIVMVEEPKPFRPLSVLLTQVTPCRVKSPTMNPFTSGTAAAIAQYRTSPSPRES